jgi:hypothetical protein
MLTFAYAGARFVSARKRGSKPARDDVSCDNSRAERVGRILAASFTVVSIVYERKQHIRPGGGDVSLRCQVFSRVFSHRRFFRPGKGYHSRRHGILVPGSFLRHLRNEPGHNRNEDDRQDCDDRDDSSGPEVVRFGLAGLRQSFGQAPSFRVKTHGARARRRGCGLRLFSQPEHPAFDRMEKSPPSAPRSFVPVHSHLILRK